ncbi:hypothetical protein Mapa_013546 [Marchantia paleacea]|nr:hypothetical protein Mapa_013546 [Marchantia paleacea]
MWLATLRTNVCLTSLLLSVVVNLLLLALGEFKNDEKLIRAAGLAAIVVSFIACHKLSTVKTRSLNSLWENSLPPSICARLHRARTRRKMNSLIIN